MKRAYFRFYEELNDFLPAEKRKTRFVHNFKERASIKDMIEALGVPHTEVDLILVNDDSVDFSYIVQDEDRISVYPVFESLNIKKISRVRSEPLRETKFVLDVHLGKLARSLRMLGFDTLYQKDYTPDEVIVLSLSGKRIIISKSRNLLKRKEITHGYCLNSSDSEMQTKLVIKRFDLGDNIDPFTRCMECNSTLDIIARDKVIDKIPLKVKERQNEFKYCTQCRKIYWKGSHYVKMREKIRRLTVDD
ncbi:MAG: Mut7-C RNAse domain-containing protein [Acidobacteriota bacterium]